MFYIVPNHEQALQQIVSLKKEVSELRAKLASQEEDYHKSEGEMHAEVKWQYQNHGLNSNGKYKELANCIEKKKTTTNHDHREKIGKMK